MFSKDSEQYRKWEMEVVDSRSRLLNYYNNSKRNVGLNTTLICDKCGYETYKNDNYCICCGDRIDYDYYGKLKALISDIGVKADFAGNKILKNLDDSIFEKLKDDEYFKEKCDNYLITVFYFFSSYVFDKETIIEMVDTIDGMDELCQFLLLSLFRSTMISYPNLINSKIENWKGYGFLLNYNHVNISELDFIYYLSSELNSEKHYKRTTSNNVPDYNRIKNLWERHANNDLSLGEYVVGSAVLLDGVYKSYKLDFGKIDWNYREVEPNIIECLVDPILYTKLYVLFVTTYTFSGGATYLKEWLNVVKKQNMYPSDELILLHRVQIYAVKNGWK